mmetsp:Transcript_17965/g.27201  ORF Transcript_17965/g.27201 Transcript_17965/m.27201 type:complete len:217 (+) Transcript_17965:2714-3364(+)
MQLLQVIDAGGVVIALDTAFAQCQIFQLLTVRLGGRHHRRFMMICEEDRQDQGMILIRLGGAILTLIIMAVVIVANAPESLVVVLRDTAEEAAVVVIGNMNGMTATTIDIVIVGLAVTVLGAKEIGAAGDRVKETEGGIEIVSVPDREIEGDGRIVRAPRVIVEVAVRALKEVAAQDRRDETEITSAGLVMQNQLSLHLVRESVSAVDLMTQSQEV